MQNKFTTESHIPGNNNYYYYRRDHLGNVREVWKTTDAGTQTVQCTRYYPSGLPWKYQAGDSASLQPYKFNSCEFIETHGYDVTDLGNRGVYHAINRFTSMDRFAEKYPWQSPYAHAGNNPVNFVDMGGDFPAFVIPLIKGVAGAVVDAAAQVSVFMANGKSFSQSLSNIDYTSVGTSFLTSALAGPGISTGTKIGMGIATTTDALVDVKVNGEVEAIGGIVGENKPVGKIAVDAVSSVAPGKAANELVSGLNKAISSDLSSSAAAAMTKEVRSELVNAQKNINSLSGEIIRESTANFTGSLIGGQANEIFESTSTSLPPSLPANSIIQQNDATRIQQNYYEIKIKNPW